MFGLKYFLSSQSAILWMSMVFFMSTAFYWIGMFCRAEGSAMLLHRLAPRLGGRGLALIGTMVRWYRAI